MIHNSTSVNGSSGKMDSQRWARLKRVFAAALERKTSEERIGFIRESCSDDRTLCLEAESMLVQADAMLTLKGGVVMIN